MPRDPAPALSRPVTATSLPAGGVHREIVTTPEERAALAAQLGVERVIEAGGEFLVAPRRGGARVTGRVRAVVPRTCVATLEPFDEVVDEPVEVEFVDEAALPRVARGVPPEHGFGLDDPDPPELLVDGTIDLGTLTAEFIALGLSTYPRKPGAAFEEEAERPARDNPFAVLKGLKGEGG